MFDYTVIKLTFLCTHACNFRRGSSFNYNEQKTDFGNIRTHSQGHYRILTLLLSPYTENHKPLGIYTGCENVFFILLYSVLSNKHSANFARNAHRTVCRSSCKGPITLSSLKENWYGTNYYSKGPSNKSVQQFSTWFVCSDSQTDRRKMLF